MKHVPGDRGHPVATFDWSETVSPSGAAIGAVADVTDTAPTELPPLYRSVDSDSLNSMLDQMRSRSIEGAVAFEYCDHWMVLRADGEGCIYEMDETA